MKNLTKKIDVLLAMPERKILLLLILMFELNHKNWKRIAGTGQIFC